MEHPERPLTVRERQERIRAGVCSARANCAAKGKCGGKGRKIVKEKKEGVEKGGQIVKGEGAGKGGKEQGEKGKKRGCFWG